MSSAALTWQSGLVMVGLVASALWARRDGQRIAWILGFLLPIDYVTGVTPGILDAARYGLVAWLVICVPPGVSPHTRRAIYRLAGLIVVLGSVRLAFALPRHDRNGIVFAAVMLLSAIACTLIALRPRVHRPLIAGYLAGLFLSAVTCIMQALGIPALRVGNTDGHRYPGLAVLTMLLTWQLAFGIIICVYLASTARPRSRSRHIAVLMGSVFLVALAANGAQGGLVGLVVAAGAYGWCKRDSLDARAALRFGARALATLAAAALFVLVSGMQVPSVDGLFGEGNYTNEKARWDIDVAGFREMWSHPIAGMGRSPFMEKYGLAPHFLPMDSGISAGIVAFAISSILVIYVYWLVIGGPRDHRAITLTGFAVLAAAASNTFTEANAPFTGLARAAVLFIALVASQGEYPDEFRERQPDADRWGTETRSNPELRSGTN